MGFGNETLMEMVEEFNLDTCRGQIEDNIIGHIKNTLNRAIKYYASKYQIFMEFMRDYALDQRITKLPTMTKESFTAELDGTISIGGSDCRNNRVEIPVHLPEPDPENNATMQIFLSDYVINSLLDDMARMHQLNVNSTRMMGPEGNLITITTDTLEPLLPRIVERHGPNVPGYVYCEAYSEPSPFVDSREGELLFGRARGFCNVTLMKKEEHFRVFSLEGILYFKGRMFIDDSALNNVVYSLRNGTMIDAKILESGGFEVRQSDMLRELNKMLGHMKGPVRFKYPLPMLPFVKMPNVTIDYFNGFVRLNTNAEFIYVKCC